MNTPRKILNWFLILIVLIGNQSLLIAQGISPAKCDAIMGLNLDYTTVSTTEYVSAGKFVPPAGAWIPPGNYFETLPAFCRVRATISPVPDSQIDFEIWLPVENWNGKFVGTGNGGFFGAIARHVMANPLSKGYAVANSDLGHKGGAADSSFAIDQPQKVIDYGWRATHEMTVKSKAIVEEYYNRPAHLSYWTGCSAGGRQGITEAERFPEDYDAIFAGAPGINTVSLASQWILIQQRLTDPVFPLPTNKLSLLKEAAVTACDANDGVIDEVINEPLMCKFDPASLQCQAGHSQACLLAHEIDAALEIYRGPVNPRTGELIYPGPEFGSELEWSSFTPDATPQGESFFRDFVFGDPDWDLFSFDFDVDVDRSIALNPGDIMTINPDLSAFVERGGKLILWHGLSDGFISPQKTIDYYIGVKETMGSEVVENSIQLLLAPGIDHCGGSAYTLGFDQLDVLDAWVEQDNIPSRVIAIQPTADGSIRTRPLCAYPQVSRYIGTGSTDDAENFECINPMN